MSLIGIRESPPGKMASELNRSEPNQRRAGRAVGGEGMAGAMKLLDSQGTVSGLRLLGRKIPAKGRGKRRGRRGSGDT